MALAPVLLRPPGPWWSLPSYKSSSPSTTLAVGVHLGPPRGLPMVHRAIHDPPDDAWVEAQDRAIYVV